MEKKKELQNSISIDLSAYKMNGDDVNMKDVEKLCCKIIEVIEKNKMYCGGGMSIRESGLTVKAKLKKVYC